MMLRGQVVSFLGGTITHVYSSIFTLSLYYAIRSHEKSMIEYMTDIALFYHVKIYK